MAKLDWIIKLTANGVRCQDCGKVDNYYPEYICNAKTYGMNKYDHPEFQVVIHMSQDKIGYVLNKLGLLVQAGKRFKDGDVVDDLFIDFPIRLDAFEEHGHTVLRVILPDSKKRFPEDKDCDYPYNLQALPMEQLERRGGAVS